MAARRAPDQPDLLDWTPPQPVRRFDDQRVRAVSQRDRPKQVRLGLGMGLGPLGIGVNAPVGDRRGESYGSLVLEVQDFRSKAVVWKATAERALEGSDSAEEAEAAAKAAVDGMLKRFPPPAK